MRWENYEHRMTDGKVTMSQGRSGERQNHEFSPTSGVYTESEEFSLQEKYRGVHLVGSGWVDFDLAVPPSAWFCLG